MSVSVFDEIAGERARQNVKWGVQNHPDGTGEPHDVELAGLYRRITDASSANGVVTYRDILREEVYEAFAERDPAALRTELIQVAAVAVQWVEAIDRREAAS